jgi:hypothetical protein
MLPRVNFSKITQTSCFCQFVRSDQLYFSDVFRFPFEPKISDVFEVPFEPKFSTLFEPRVRTSDLDSISSFLSSRTHGRTDVLLLLCLLFRYSLPDWWTKGGVSGHCVHVHCVNSQRTSVLIFSHRTCVLMPIEFGTCYEKP